MLKVLFVNGPPGAGKDSVGKIAGLYLPDVQVAKFAKALKERTHALYGLYWPHEGGDQGPLPHDSFDAVKDQPRDEFMGLTPRQAYIAVSETYMKVQHGQRIWGEILKRELLDQCGPPGQLFVITDSGFRPEAEVIVEAFGADRCALLRVSRPGHDFKNDSRGYVDLSDLGVRCISLPDCSDLSQLERAAVTAFRQLGLLESNREESPALFAGRLPPSGPELRRPSER